MVPTDLSAPPLAVRPREAARLLGISARTLWSLSAPRGPIPCARLGHGRNKAVLYPVADLRAWLAAQAQTTVGDARQSDAPC
jgi:hypothetical protein